MNNYVKAGMLTIFWIVVASLYFLAVVKLPVVLGGIVAISPILAMIYYTCLLHIRVRESTKRIAALEVQ